MKRVYVIALVGLALIIGTYFLWFPPIKGNSTIPVPTPIQNLDSDKLFQLVNEWRTQNGYQPYIVDERLCKIASDRADDLINDFSHQDLYDKYSNYPYVMQENIVHSETSESVALKWWLNSPSHLAGLQKPYVYSCIRCYKNDCSQIFSSFKTDPANPY